MGPETARHIVLSQPEPRESAVRREAHNAFVLILAATILNSKRPEPKAPPFFHPRQRVRTSVGVFPQRPLGLVRDKKHCQQAKTDDGQLGWAQADETVSHVELDPGIFGVPEVEAHHEGAIWTHVAHDQLAPATNSTCSERSPVSGDLFAFSDSAKATADPP